MSSAGSSLSGDWSGEVYGNANGNGGRETVGSKMDLVEEIERGIRRVDRW